MGGGAQGGPRNSWGGGGGWFWAGILQGGLGSGPREFSYTDKPKKYLLGGFKPPYPPDPPLGGGGAGHSNQMDGNYQILKISLSKIGGGGLLRPLDLPLIVDCVQLINNYTQYSHICKVTQTNHIVSFT